MILKIEKGVLRLMYEALPVILFLAVSLILGAAGFISNRKKTKELEKFCATFNFKIEKTFSGFKISGVYKSFEFEITRANKNKQVFFNYFIQLPASQTIILHINSDNPILKLFKNITGIKTIETQNTVFDKKFKIEASGPYESLLKNQEFQNKLLNIESFSSLDITENDVVLEVWAKDFSGDYILKNLEEAAGLSLMVHKAQGILPTDKDARKKPAEEFSEYSYASQRVKPASTAAQTTHYGSGRPVSKSEIKHTAPSQPSSLYSNSAENRPTGKLCPRCRADLKGNDKICPSCGFKLKKSIFDFLK